MILQQVIESDLQYHVVVIGGEKTLLMPYSLSTGRYSEEEDRPDDGLARRMAEIALKIADIYGYEINMTEFVQQGDELYLINATNPSPLIGRDLMTETQFDWLCREIADLIARRVADPPKMKFPVKVAEL